MAKFSKLDNVRGMPTPTLTLPNPSKGEGSELPSPWGLAARVGWRGCFGKHGTRLPLRLVLITLALFAAFWGGLGLLAYRTYHAGEYPGATAIDASDMVRASSNLIFKRVEMYRSTDPFNLIYNWYSQRFDLGPERFANGNCLLMARSSTLLGPLNLNASVMVCETKADRMMFVTRTYMLRYPDWLQRLL